MYTKGIVEAINTEEKVSRNTGKPFGSASVKVNGDFYKCFANKKNGEYIVVDKNKIQLQDGMEVEFEFEQKGNFKNIDQSSIRILASGSGVQKPTESREATISSQPTDNTNDTGEERKLANFRKASIMSEAFRTATIYMGLVTDGDELKAKNLDDVERIAKVIFQKCVK